MNIVSFLKTVPEPDRPALIFPTPSNPAITFHGLDELSSQLAAGLHELGLRMNDRVILLAPISLQFYASLIAIFKLGATAVFLDPYTSYKQLDLTVNLIDAKIFIGSKKAMLLRLVIPGLRRIPHHLHVGEGRKRSTSRIAGDQPARNEICEVEPETPALITFTAGGTDIDGPRGVVRTHRLLAAQHAAISRNIPNLPNDIDMPSFPIVTLHNLAAGITSIIPDFPFHRPQSLKPERVIDQIEKHEVTTASGSPTFWQSIAEYSKTQKMQLPLRRILVGGAPTMPDLMNQLNQMAPHAEILGVYGSTEAEPVSLISAHEILSETTALTANGSGIPVGHPIPEIKTMILDENRREQSIGGCGEIWVAGEHVANSYFHSNGSGASRKHHISGGRDWHFMGDMGYKDQKGRLWLTGRINSVIKKRYGEPIYPLTVEAALSMLPYIHRTALVGIGNIDRKMVLVVELRPGKTEPSDWQAQIKMFCEEHGWQLDAIHRIHRIPVDPRHNARIDYNRLRSLFDEYP